MNEKNKRYWSARFLRAKYAGFQKVDLTVEELQQVHMQSLERLLSDVQAFYQRYATENRVSLSEAKKQLDKRELQAFKLTLEEYITMAQNANMPKRHLDMLKQASLRVRLDRAQALLIHMAHHTELLFQKENPIIMDTLTDLYEDSYYKTAYETQKLIGFSTFHAIPKRQIIGIIEKPWLSDEIGISSRIWNNRNATINALTKELLQGLAVGEGYTTMANRLAAAMNTSFFNAKRLVTTEAAHVMEQASHDAYKELNVDKYEIIATLDTKTSSICQNMDKLVVDMKDYKPGVTAPPFHPHCRTTTIPYIEDLITTRQSREEKEGRSIRVSSTLTYDEWIQQIKKNSTKATDN